MNDEEEECNVDYKIGWPGAIAASVFFLCLAAVVITLIIVGPR